MFKRMRYIIFSLSLFLTAYSYAAPQVVDLKKQLDLHLNNSSPGLSVHEFQYIRLQAAHLGLRIWLYGGTAASFAHYVTQTSLAAGAVRASEIHLRDFISDLQDIDLVVDGDSDKVKEFSRRVHRKFRYFSASGRDRWDIGKLYDDFGPRKPIFNNSEVLNQHNDSWSMGLIEITDPLEGESRVLSPAHVEDFLSSILNKEIHFYFAQNHNQTDRYLEGKNPEIIAVIRFLTKAHHFGLNIKEEDWQLIKQLSLDFEATQTYDKYVYNWLKFNVHKMLFLAKDKGALMAHLESLGLRAKLSHLHEHFDSEVNQFLRPKSCSIFLGAGLYF